MSLPALTRCLLLQECYQGKRLTTGENDKVLAEAVAQARGMRHPHTLRCDEAWRLATGPRR